MTDTIRVGYARAVRAGRTFGHYQLGLLELT